jgi:nitric oxide reductase subunit B
MMHKGTRIFLGFALVMLITTLFFGMLASFSYLNPEFYNQYIPFYQLRPMHVSAALFWIIGGATSCLLFLKKEVSEEGAKQTIVERIFINLWMFTVVVIFVFYSLKKFGGREYWEFPPFLCLPLLISWVALMIAWFKAWFKAKEYPLYVWMWTSGICFFLFTFLEQNLYQIPYFRHAFLREVIVQWKSNGSMVGSWNQIIYGLSLFLMVKLTDDSSIAKSKTAFYFFFLSLSNMMFNWGHHIYNVPSASWLRDVSYGISMTEWLFFIKMLQSFKAKMDTRNRLRHLFTFKLIVASEVWVFFNLLLALLMSIPAVNRYTHGTHITVAHAMGATIGINTMILLAAMSYILRIDDMGMRDRRWMHWGYYIAQISLGGFWISLIIAGFLKGIRQFEFPNITYQELMVPVNFWLRILSFSGAFLFLGFLMMLRGYFKALKQS